MKDFFSKYTNEIKVVLLGIFIVLVYYFGFEIYSQQLIYPDTESYIAAADSLYFHGRGHNLRPILLALIHGFPLLFTSTKTELIEWNSIINCCCYITTSLLLYKILTTYISNKKAFFICSLYMLSISTIAFIFHMLSESIFTCVIVTSIYFLTQYQIKKKYTYLVYFLSLISLSMLIRPGTQFLAILVLFYFREEVFYNRKIKSNFLLISSWLLIVIQMAGIKYQFGNFTISYVNSITYYSYLGSKADQMKKNLPYDQLKNPRNKYIYSLNYPEQKKIASQDLKNQVLNNTFYLFKAYLDNLYHNTIDSSLAINDLKTKHTLIKKTAILISSIQNIFFTLIGVLLCLYYLILEQPRNKLLIITCLIISYVFLTSGISCSQGDRFHIVVYPLIIIVLSLFLKKRKVIS